MQQQPDPFILNLPPNTILQQIRITTQKSQVTIQPIISPQFKLGDIIKVKEGQIGVFDSCTSEHTTFKVCITKENIRLNKNIFCIWNKMLHLNSSKIYVSIRSRNND